MTGRGVVRTADLLLRPVRVEDVPRLVEVETDPRTTLHSPSGPPTAHEAERLLLSAAAEWAAGGVGYWAVEHAGRLIGTAGIRRVTLHDRPCWNLYYRLAPEAWGRGLASQAALAATAYVAELDGLPVVARTRPANTGAQRVAVKAGLQRRPELDSSGFHTYASDW